MGHGAEEPAAWRAFLVKGLFTNGPPWANVAGGGIDGAVAMAKLIVWAAIVVALSCGLIAEAAAQSALTARLEQRGFVRDEGYFPAIYDAASGTLVLEIPAERLGQEFLAYTVTERGQESDLVVGVADRAVILRLEERRGGRLDIVEIDPTVRYDPASPLSRRSDAASPKRVLGTTRIVEREGQGETLFVQGLPLIIAAASGAFPDPQGGQQAKGPPEIVSVGVHPRNTDVVLDSDERERTLFGLRGDALQQTVRVRRRVSLVALPDAPFATRLSDPRVGFFTADVTDPSRLGRQTTDRFARRFRLEKQDPDAALSPPVEPIVFWLENTTPFVFRKPVTEAVLAWNTAFEAAGFTGAIEVRQMPDDAAWAPGDIRYNVLRWVAKDTEFLYGAGPSVYDPRTGEQLGADIYLGYSLFAGRLNVPTQTDSVRLGRLDPGFDDSAPSRAMLEKVRNTVIHEVGHTLGLRHNFRGSTWLDLDGFLDAAAQGRQTTASVMDYMPIHIAGAGEAQGSYIDGTPGPYDVWAIQFGYDPALTDETAREAHLARAGEPGLAFASDTAAIEGRLGIDPRVQRRDATSDPVGYAAYQVEAARSLMRELLVRQAATGIAPGAFRESYGLATRQRRGAALAAVRFVGGVYVDPLVPNAPRTGAVYTPVPAATQRAALAVVEEAVFRPGAFAEDVALAPNLQDAATRFARPDVEGQALFAQRAVLGHLLDPIVLERMSDAGFYGGEFSPGAMLRAINEMIIGDDLTGTPDTVRRNGQIAYVEALVALSENGRAKPVVRTAAFEALRDVRGRMGLTDLLMKPGYKAHRAHVGRLLNGAGV